MAQKRDGKRFPRRLPRLRTDAALNRMARMPSHLAPYAEELLQVEPFTPPTAPAMSLMERGLLDMVLENPDDDEPRRMYADWLMSQGDPRGEFIHVQLKLQSRRSGYLPDLGIINPANALEQHIVSVGQIARPTELLDREIELLDQHAEPWTQQFQPWSARDFVWQRGFVTGVSLSGRCFISISNGLFDTAPITDVRLVAINPYIDELTQTKNLQHLRRLDLMGNQIPPSELISLLQSPYLTQLQSLGLSGNPLGHGDLDALVHTPCFSQLRELDAAHSGLNIEQAATLIDSVQSIDLSCNKLLSLPKVDHLQRLNVAECRLNTIDLAALQQCQQLDISFNRLSHVDGIVALTTLCQLNIAGNRLTSLPIVDMPDLRELNLSVNPLSDALIPFFKGSTLPMLYKLNLCNTQLTDSILLQLVQSEAWSGLRSLKLAGNSLSIRAIFTLENLQQLRELAVDHDCAELQGRFPRVRFIR